MNLHSPLPARKLVAEPLLLDTVTFVADGALPLSVIVQVELAGGVTLLGLHVRFVSVGTGGNSVTVAVLEMPFNVAVIVAVVLLVTRRGRHPKGCRRRIRAHHCR